MKVSLLIVTRKWNPNFSYIKELKRRDIDFEVLIAEGTNPSTQRNLLAKSAKGEFVLFLDDDSWPIPELLEKYQHTIQNYPEIQIVGGPALLIAKNNHISQLSGIFFSSIFGIGPIRSRYNSLGSIRNASEKDLILCNLLVRKDFFLKTNGFDQQIYPGEENKFLKSIHKSSKILYDPEAIVYREPRTTFSLFLKQMFSYGKGRSKHLELNYLFEYFFLIPLVFSTYILSLPFLIRISFFFSAPLLLHFLLSPLTLVGRNKNEMGMFQKATLPLFFITGHFSYGLGLLIGLIKYKIFRRFNSENRLNANIKIHFLKSFKKDYT
jgi:succinoglycan biosynthesis protein ExoA